MGRASRSKGKRGEREVVKRFIAAGVPCRRRWEEQSKPGGQENGDLAIGEAEEVYAEVRHQEVLRIPAWLREVEEKAKGRPRALIFRRNREDWHVAVPLDDYIELLKGQL
jgi:hypothetical protein